MDQKEITLEVVTPMFISGPDTTRSELRAPAIKGLLRWWWRALNGDLTIKELKAKEELIYGSTKRKSSFSINIETNDSVEEKLDNLPSGKKIEVTSRGKTFYISIIDYLAFGIAEYVKRQKCNVYKRPYITSGSKFKLLLRFYNDEHKEEVLNAVTALISYGGLGSKSRNGFGSIHAIEKQKKISLPKMNSARYHAFSDNSKEFIFNIHNEWVDALVEIGTHYRQARLNLEPRHVWDKRQLVAKPIEVKREISIPDRHAKPFFLHIDKINNSYRGKILFMPYKYYESNKQNEYDDVMVEMCDYLKKNAREVNNVL